MNYLYSRWLQQTVDKVQDNLVTAVSTFLDSHVERRVVITADTRELKIKDAYLETLRLPGKHLEQPITVQLPLAGIAAYFGSGKKLLQALTDFDRDEIDLVLETVSGFIQAETYFYQERDIEASNHREYDQYWEKLYVNSCNYYCNLDRVQQGFMEKVQPQYRNNYLFSRQHNAACFQLADNAFRLNLNFADSYHEIGLIVEVAGSDRTITGVWGNLLRYPDQVCREAELTLPRLIGVSLTKTKAKELSSLVGGQDGCTHMRQMLVEAAKCFQAIDPAGK